MNLARSIETRCLYALTLCALLAANVPAAAQYDRTVEGTRKALMALVDRMKNMEETESGQALEDEEAEQGGEWRLRSSADAEAHGAGGGQHAVPERCSRGAAGLGGYASRRRIAVSAGRPASGEATQAHV